jgi:transcriptional regulator with XRE-family HTH domain
MVLLDQDEKQLIISRLKEVRKDNDLTLKDLGAIMGVSEATASRYESGGVEEIPKKRIKALAEKYGLNPAWILGLSDKKFMYGKE